MGALVGPLLFGNPPYYTVAVEIYDRAPERLAWVDAAGWALLGTLTIGAVLGGLTLLGDGWPDERDEADRARHAVPGAGPALVVAALLAFVASINDLIMSLFVGGVVVRTLPTVIWPEIHHAVGPDVAAASGLLLAVAVVGSGLALAVRHRRPTAAEDGCRWSPSPVASGGSGVLGGDERHLWVDASPSSITGENLIGAEMGPRGDHEGVREP